MQRLLFLLGLLVVLAGGLLSLAVYLAFGFGEASSDNVVVNGLSQTVEVAMADQAVVHIRAHNESDAYTALGYMHARRQAWAMTFWRQTATGRLSEWFGEATLAVDRLTRTLGLRALARTAYARLPPEDQAILVAYSRGVNAAFSDPVIQQGDDFVLLDLPLEPWQPWHCLALERLLAWIAAPPPTHDPAIAWPPSLQAFVSDNAHLRAWVHLQGFEHSMAWVMQDSAQTYLFQRYVQGDGALPLFQETVLHWPGYILAGASVPGFPVWPTARTDSVAWSLLLLSSSPSVRSAATTPGVPLLHERILTDPHGSELVLPIRRSETTLLLATAAETPDSTAWWLEWPGFSTPSDWPAWRALARGAQPSPFQLVQGAGLVLERDGSWQVLGPPTLARPLPGGTWVSGSSWAPTLDERFRQLQLNGRMLSSPDALYLDVYSPWAASLVPDMIRRVTTPEPLTDPSLNEALTYLQNWDHRFDAASIGASIFDRWVAVYHNHTGRLPGQTAALDTTNGNTYRETLRRSVATLSEQFGPDPSQWRWETTQPGARFYPVWSDSAALPSRLRSLSTTRYAPLPASGDGHPSTLLWWPSNIRNGRPATAAWGGWIGSDSWDTLTLLQYNRPARSFLGRYRLPYQPNTSLTLRIQPTTRQTTITLKPNLE